MLNTKNEGQPTSSDVKRDLRTMSSDDDAIDYFFDGLIQTGGAMYLLGIHYAVLKTLMTNPNQYAERVVGTTPDISEFKKNPTIPAMQHFLMRQCSSDETSTPRPYAKTKRKLALLLDDDLDTAAGVSTSDLASTKPPPLTPSKKGRLIYHCMKATVTMTSHLPLVIIPPQRNKIDIGECGFVSPIFSKFDIKSQKKIVHIPVLFEQKTNLPIIIQSK